jgi:hypothetical protein
MIEPTRHDGGSVGYDFPCVRADYRPHPIARYSQNPLISALPTLPAKRTELKLALNSLPEFTPADLLLDRQSRRLLLKQLSRFFIALPRVCELAESIYANVVEGYVGREPFTAEANLRLQKLYKAQNVGAFCSLGPTRNTAQFTSALLGSPGAGKSLSLAHIAALFPPVIHHPSIDLFQIPVLHIEMAYNGLSLATLAHAIIRAIARAFPDGDYERLYLKSRGNSEQQLLAAFALMHIHAVGMLIVDEAQNSDYKLDDAAGGGVRVVRKRGVAQTPLTTLLITASNTLQVPLLLAGTAEMRQVMGSRMSKVRRMVGSGLRPWGPLNIVATGNQKHSEYDVFLSTLWQYQLLQAPAPLTPEMRNIFHYYSFGVPDFVVKLFHDVQWRALMNGRETFDQALVHEVAATEMAAVTRLTAAMRKREDSASKAILSTVTDLSAEFGITDTNIDLDDEDSMPLHQVHAEMKANPHPYYSKLHPQVSSPDGTTRFGNNSER